MGAKTKTPTVHPALDVDMDGEPDTDLTILREPCERDDASKYRSDGVILTDHGSVRCDEEEERQEEISTRYPYHHCGNDSTQLSVG